MNNPRSLPEIFRHRSSELSSNRLLLSFVTIQVVCVCLLIIARKANTNDAASIFFYCTWAIQSLVLVGYGCQRLSTAISGERERKTWDFQRMTPLSSFQIVTGKLLGAPIFGYVMAAFFLPWTLGTALVASPELRTEILWCHLYTLAAVVLLFGITLMFTAQSEKGVMGRKTSSAPVFVILFFFLSFLGPMVAAIQRNQGYDIYFWGSAFQAKLFIPVSAILFGTWAYLGCKWKVGAELLESPNGWRALSFLTFAFVYVLGVGRGSTSWTRNDFAPVSSITATAVAISFVYAYALLGKSGVDTWRAIAACRTTGRRFHRLPAWVMGAIAVLPMTLVAEGLIRDSSDAARISLGLLPCFLVRDLLFLQWCRFGSSKRPEVMAILYLTLLYALPSALLTAMKAEELFYVFTPVPSVMTPAVTHFIPILIQILLIGAVLLHRSKRVLRQAPALSR